VDLACYAFLSLRPKLRTEVLEYLASADRSMLERGLVDLEARQPLDSQEARAEINDCCGFEVFTTETLYEGDAVQSGWSDDEYAFLAAQVIGHVLPFAEESAERDRAALQA
jgi:hypothetical protein